MDSAERVDVGFVSGVRGARRRGGWGAGGLSAEEGVRLFESQATSRHLDLAARRLRKEGHGYYTIGSSGHEGNVVVAAVTRATDPAFLHYRSGAFFVERARQVAGQDPVRDVLLGMMAAREEPIAGGRHKVFGSAELAIPPQTSTIASHLPKAMGTAFAIERRKRLGLGSASRGAAPEDAIVICSFGDASTNHSVAQGAIAAACHASFQHLGMPVLFVCEDNGIGISVTTPPGWIARAFSERPGLAYFHADGCDLLAAHAAAREAVAHVRQKRRPAFLHLSVVRLMAHAGSDLEESYRSPAAIRATEACDPLLATARILVENGAATAEELLERYEAIRREVSEKAERAIRSERLRDAADVMAPLAKRRPDAVAAEAARLADTNARERFFEGKLPEAAGPAPLAVHVNRALADLLLVHPEMLVFGEDVGPKGGVYGVTRGLSKRAGVLRVFDTILDETTILGLAIGGAHAGLLPVPEIQYLAYLHNAEDQLRGEAATLSFFSQGQYTNGMVVRIAGYAYQKGFGGHFHNDNSIAVLRDIPGVVIASPSRGDDAAAILRTCVAAAKVDGTVCAFLEPIALYQTRDLHEPGDDLWAPVYDPTAHVPIGRARTHGDGEDVLIVSFANGVPMSLRAARRLESRGVRARVLDLRFIAPLPVEDLLREASAVRAVLVADETRRTGGVAEGVLAALIDARYDRPIARVASEDSFIPLGDAAHHVLLSEQAIEDAALALSAEAGAPRSFEG